MIGLGNHGIRCGDPENRTVEERVMLQEPARLKVTRHGETVQVEFNSRKILDEANIQEIGEQLTALIEREDIPRIVISFGSVDHLSSAALGTLITINNKVKQKGGQLRLSDINPQIYEVFLITKLNKLFRIYPTAKEAQDSLQPA
jgi:anti-sigma B factor antagonist